MRKVLDRFYLGCGWLAAFFLAAIAGCTVVQVVAREFGKAVEMTELSGFCMAASTFLGLAYTLRSGTHVRVDLFAHRLGRRGRRALEFWAAAAGMLAVGGLTWAFAAFTWQSWSYHDVSPGLLAIPFWIPQVGVTIGLFGLAVAFADDAIRVLKGRTPAFASTGDASE